MKRFFILFFISFLVSGILLESKTLNANVIDFEDLSLNIESYWNGSDGSGGFTSAGAFFNNNYDPSWLSWDGFSYSNRTDTQISDWENSQFNAISGSGVDGSAIYAIGYNSAFAADPPTITLPSEQKVIGAYFTNTNYAYYSMLHGDAFAKQFEAGDWFKLTITGKDSQGNITGTSEVYLAEGRDILHTWKWEDLSGLGKVKSLEFTLSSTDNSPFGMNTPAYFCMDNLELKSKATNIKYNANTNMILNFLEQNLLWGQSGLGSYYINQNIGVYYHNDSFNRSFMQYPFSGFYNVYPSGLNYGNSDGFYPGGNTYINYPVYFSAGMGFNTNPFYALFNQTPNSGSFINPSSRYLYLGSWGNSLGLFNNRPYGANPYNNYPYEINPYNYLWWNL